MQNKIQVFTNEKFGSIRTVMIDGGPWFVAADVCRALDIGNPTDALRRLDADEKALVSIEGLSRGNSKGNIISEPGLYSLALSSRKPEAKAFKRWIIHDVIPAIRRHGAYITDAKLAQIPGDPTQAHLLVMEYASELLKNERLSMRLADAQPKAEYYDTFVNPGECTNIRTTAKQLGVPERKFVRYLLDHRYMYRSRSGILMPHFHYYNRGFFAIRDFHLPHSPQVEHYTLITARGKEHLMGKVQAMISEGDGMEGQMSFTTI